MQPLLKECIYINRLRYIDQKHLFRCLQDEWMQEDKGLELLHKD
jgi:hypothetical protein